jgi:hypothetical protein
VHINSFIRVIIHTSQQKQDHQSSGQPPSGQFEQNRLVSHTREMADSLISALEKVHLETCASDGLADDGIDCVLDEQRPRKRIKKDQNQLKRDLEQKYLTPLTSFSQEWLNRLQQ